MCNAEATVHHKAAETIRTPVSKIVLSQATAALMSAVCSSKVFVYHEIRKSRWLADRSVQARRVCGYTWSFRCCALSSLLIWVLRLFCRSHHGWITNQVVEGAEMQQSFNSMALRRDLGWKMRRNQSAQWSVGRTSRMEKYWGWWQFWAKALFFFTEMTMLKIWEENLILLLS